MRCVPSAAQNSRMHSRLYFSHRSLAGTGKVSRLLLNMLAVRRRSKTCSKNSRASRAAIVAPETMVLIEFTKPAVGAGLLATLHVGMSGGRVTFKATPAPARLGNGVEEAVAKSPSVALSYAVMPNTSLEARPNIKTPGPCGGRAHFPPHGPGVLLSVPPQLER